MSANAHVHKTSFVYFVAVSKYPFNAENVHTVAAVFVAYLMAFLQRVRIARNAERCTS